VPGHGVIIPVDAGDAGGARGCIRRWKASIMIMRPPQHGQGGRGDPRDRLVRIVHAL
jgi:hypothetical protein